MRSPRPSRVAEVVREGIPLAMPSILLVTGAFFLGFDTHGMRLWSPTKESRTQIDSEWEEGDRSFGSFQFHDALFHQKIVESSMTPSIQKPIHA